MVTPVAKKTHQQEISFIYEDEEKKSVSSTTKELQENKNVQLCGRKKHKRNYEPLIISRQFSKMEIKLTRAGIQVCEWVASFGATLILVMHRPILSCNKAQGFDLILALIDAYETVSLETPFMGFFADTRKST
jgi:hypothetical protein